jgi:hypothetical protein
VKRKGIIVAVGSIAALAVGVSVATAATSYSTNIRADGVFGTPTAATVFGHLQTSRICLGPRLMQESKGSKVIDQDFSSANGAFAFRGNIAPLPAILTIQVAKTTIKNSSGQVVAVCQPKTVQVRITRGKLGAR